MIYYKTEPKDDPYYDLWNSPEWLFPFDNLDKLKYPKIISLEPVNICQNNCIYCQMRLMDRETGQIDLNLVEKIAIEAEEYGASVRLGGFGEPLVHKEIVRLIEILKEHNIRTTLFTNGNLLTGEMVRRFCEIGLDEIVFSGSGVTQEVHNKVRKKSDYNRDFKEKILLAHDIRNQVGSNKPYFRIYTNVFSYDDSVFKKNLDDYVDYFIQYVDKIDIDITNMNRVGELEDAKEYLIDQAIDTTYKPCVTLYHKWLVHWNGDIFFCDIPHNEIEEYRVGNVADSSIAELYYSEKVELMREKTKKLEHSSLPLCKSCYSNPKYDSLKEKYLAEITP